MVRCRAGKLSPSDQKGREPRFNMIVKFPSDTLVCMGGCTSAPAQQATSREEEEVHLKREGADVWTGRQPAKRVKNSEINRIKEIQT